MSRRKSAIETITFAFTTLPLAEAQAALAVARTIVAARTAPAPRAAKADRTPKMITVPSSTGRTVKVPKLAGTAVTGDEHLRGEKDVQ